MLAFRSLLFLLFQTATVVPFAFASILMLPLPLHFRYRVIACWPRICIWALRVLCGVRWEVQGMENLPDGPCILLSKHQSTWETFFFPATMPRELCFVYKRELHWVPFFGWGIASLRMIHINRGRSQQAWESVVAQGSQRMAEGRWIIMFPEGTRTPAGTKGRYKSGGTRLAVRLGVPVVPIAHNAGRFWPRKRFLKTPGTVHVSIGAPIPSVGSTPERLIAEVEQWIEAEVERIDVVPPSRDAVHAAA